MVSAGYQMNSHVRKSNGMFKGRNIMKVVTVTIIVALGSIGFTSISWADDVDKTKDEMGQMESEMRGKARELKSRTGNMKNDMRGKMKDMQREMGKTDDKMKGTAGDMKGKAGDIKDDVHGSMNEMQSDMGKMRDNLRGK
jgi:uncharacterized protein YukE